MIKRPAEYNTVLHENHRAYGSYTHVAGRWMGGLFARRGLRAGEVIARYVGEEYHPPALAESVDDQAYMFTARMVGDGRKRVVIDGNPELYSNLAGYANYVEGDAANAHFVDKSKEVVPSESDGATTYVVLQAAEDIPTGTEIRVDYDMGSRGHPFRDQMISKGVPLRALRGRAYSRTKWVYPNVPHARATYAPGSHSSSLPTTRPVARVVPFLATAERPPAPSRSPSPLRRSAAKRPRGRPPKGKTWNVRRGEYV